MDSDDTGVFLSQHLALFPPPLHIKKRHPRRKSFQRLVRRRTNSSRTYTYNNRGPLDDIIDEIAEAFLLSSHEAIDKNPSSLFWSITSLPVSHVPSNRPLNVRKARASRSTASGTTASDTTRQTSQGSNKSEYTEYKLDDFYRPPSASSTSDSHYISYHSGSSEIAGSQLALQRIEDISASGQHALSARDQLDKINAIAPCVQHTRSQQRGRFLSLSSALEKFHLPTLRRHSKHDSMSSTERSKHEPEDLVENSSKKLTM